jgi:steroid Delta-isomerase
MSALKVEQLVERLREALGSFGLEGEGVLPRLAELYDPDVVFRDPLQTLIGREAFMAMNRRILRRARRISFDVADAVAGADSLFLTWSMTYEPLRGPTIVFLGSTHARVRGGVITEQRDYWDFVSSLAASLPIVRRIYAALAPRLG